MLNLTYGKPTSALCWQPPVWPTNDTAAAITDQVSGLSASPRGVTYSSFESGFRIRFEVQTSKKIQTRTFENVKEKSRDFEKYSARARFN
jgi:hypothetical protein